MMVKSGQRFRPQAMDFEQQVHSTFSKASLLSLIGAKLVKINPGEIEVSLPYRKDLTQQNGFLHAGIVTSIADTACGLAAISLMSADASGLSVEFKVNLLSPAKGERFIARGKVIKPGRTIFFCSGDVFSINGEEQKLVATMTATMIKSQVRSEDSLG